MKLEQLHQLINANKKLVSIKKPVKKLLKCILYSHTGKRILRQFEEFRSDLKHDLEIIFKPCKPFTKKDLKGVDITTLYAEEKVNNDSERGTHTLREKGALLKQKSAEGNFVNWFDISGDKMSPQNASKCTFTDKYGKTSSLDVDMLNERRGVR
tara:strand:+ start:76 stop:537 length:462 start_codon:yes stop_codon:yes gene_type:complete